MKGIYKALLILFFAAVFNVPSSAQYTFFSPEGSFAIEISLENSSYNRLPIYQNSISSLAVTGDHIIGGTSAKKGLSPYIFTASLSQRELTHKLPLKKIIPGQKSIQPGFCRGKNGAFYAGSLPDSSQVESGHLFKVEISANGKLSVSDIGAPIKGEGVFSLSCNAERTKLYGISYPSGTFFSHDIATGSTQTYNKTEPSKGDHRKFHDFALDPEDYLSRDLIVDGEGRVYGSQPINKLFYFDPQADSITVMEEQLPFVWGRHTLGQVDAWAKSNDGMLYGGNSGDGQLFRLNPSTGKVTNLGKSIMMNRLRALAFARDGRLYGIAGALPGYAHLFSYDEQNGYMDLGNPQFPMVAPGIEQGIKWRGFQIATMATSEDGKYVVMGEDESLSQLMVFPVPDK